MNSDAASLDKLHDIVLAPDAPWWPPAAGWFWLVFFLLILAFVTGIFLLLRWQRNCYRREGVAEISRISAAGSDPAQRSSLVLSLTELLKRGALSAWPRNRVASLTGVAWIGFLNKTRGQKQPLDLDMEIFDRAAYDETFAANIDEEKIRALAVSARSWFRHHQVGSVEEKQP